MIRPYRLINSTEIQKLKSRLFQVVQQWNTQYSLHPLDLELAVPSKGYCSNTLSIDAADPSVARIDDHYLTLFNQVLFGENHPCFNSASQELMYILLNNLLQVEQCKVMDAITPNPDWFYTGSTCLTITLSSGKSSLNIILNPDWVKQRLAQSKPENTRISSIEDALSEESLTLNLELLPVSLPVKQLFSLQAGDVITTDHPIATPLRLMKKQALLTQAELGQSSPWKSIILKRSS